MPAILTLKDIYSRPEAFDHPDPLVRVTAIHHAGRQLAESRSEQLQTRLHDMLNDPDLFVARYTAVTLAQCGDPRAIVRILAELSRGGDAAQVEELEGCLRDCSHFPFAVMLCRRIDLNSLPAVQDLQKRDFLTQLLTMTADWFYDEAERKPSFRTYVLDFLGDVHLFARNTASGGPVVPSGPHPGHPQRDRSRFDGLQGQRTVPAIYRRCRTKPRRPPSRSRGSLCGQPPRQGRRSGRPLCPRRLRSPGTR